MKPFSPSATVKPFAPSVEGSASPAHTSRSVLAPELPGRTLARLYDSWSRHGTPPTDEDIHSTLSRGRHLDPASREASRDAFVRSCGFAVPLPSAVRAAAAFTPLLEVAAGSGMLARLLALSGADVVATDAAPTRGCCAYDLPIGAYTTVHESDAADAVHSHPERNVVVAWPHGDDWPVRMLRAMTPGRHLVHFGEGPLGCCGGEIFHETLADCFEHVRDLPAASFDGIHEEVSIFRKKYI